MTAAEADEKQARDFQLWWRDEGSGIRPRAGEDGETHARRVAESAWQRGVLCAIGCAQSMIEAIKKPRS